jgi:ABC-type polysaccharide/polyol phosphate export permease
MKKENTTLYILRLSLTLLAVTALVALALAKLTGGFLRELLVALLYCLSAAAFCMLLRRLCGSIRLLGTLLPLLVVVMLLVCPVFFDIEFLRPAQLLLPPTYFISAPYNDLHLLLLPVHAAACFGLYALLGLLRKE